MKASADELQNVIAYSEPADRRTTGSTLSRSTSASADTGIDFRRILNPKPGEWLTYNGNLSGNRYSELKQINKTNVSRLSLKWTFSIPLWSQFLPDTPYYRENMRYFGLETVPIVADGIMYVTGPNQVFALDPRTGHQIWHYSRPRTSGLVSDASLGTNRGVAILGDNVFMVTDNAHLIALNRVTGRLVWEVVMPDEPQKYGGTVAPLVVKDMVIAGVSGGDWGIRGFLSLTKPTPANAYGATGPFRPRAIRALRPGRERPWRLAAALPGSPAPMTRRPIRSSGQPAIRGRIPTIASEAATICSPTASWRSIPPPEN